MSKCQLCGEPMPPGEEMFNFHGYSGPCPKPPLVKVETPQEKMRKTFDAYLIATAERLPGHVPVACIFMPMDSKGEVQVSDATPVVLWPGDFPEDLRGWILAHVAKNYGPDGEILREHRRLP